MPQSSTANAPARRSDEADCRHDRTRRRGGDGLDQRLVDDGARGRGARAFGVRTSTSGAVGASHARRDVRLRRGSRTAAACGRSSPAPAGPRTCPACSRRRPPCRCWACPWPPGTSAARTRCTRSCRCPPASRWPRSRSARPAPPTPRCSRWRCWRPTTPTLRDALAAYRAATPRRRRRQHPAARMIAPIPSITPPADAGHPGWRPARPLLRRSPRARWATARWCSSPTRTRRPGGGRRAPRRRRTTTRQRSSRWPPRAPWSRPSSRTRRPPRWQQLADAHPGAPVARRDRDRAGPPRREAVPRRASASPSAPFSRHRDRRRRRADRGVAFPAILKTARLGYDGKGQVARRPTTTLAAALAPARQRAVRARAAARARRELSVVLARTSTAARPRYPVAAEPARPRHPRPHARARRPAGRRRTQARRAVHLHRRGARATSACWPSRCSSSATTCSSTSWRPRPHNSGHWTLDACVTSQFEQQVRAVCGLPLGDTDAAVPAVAMVNLLGDLWEHGEPDWAARARPARAHTCTCTASASRGRAARWAT